MKNNSLKTGGSLASQHVMSGFKQGCGANFANDAKNSLIHCAAVQ